MNLQRAIQVLPIADAGLKNKQHVSAAQLAVLRRAKRKAKAVLKANNIKTVAVQLNLLPNA